MYNVNHLQLLVLDATDAQLVRGCFKGARGVRTLMNVRKIRRCVTTAHVETWTRATPATVSRDTSVCRVASDVTQCRSSLAQWHNLPSALVHLSFSVSHFTCHHSTLIVLLIFV